jgi:hypothetical protein
MNYIIHLSLNCTGNKNVIPVSCIVHCSLDLFKTLFSDNISIIRINYLLFHNYFIFISYLLFNIYYNCYY